MEGMVVRPRVSDVGISCGGVEGLFCTSKSTASSLEQKIQIPNSRAGSPSDLQKNSQKNPECQISNLNRSPDFDGSTSLFSMPNDGEVTLLFEPTVAHWLLSLPHSCFGFGVGLFLFGLIGFLRFHRWAIAGMFFGCAIAVFLSMFHTRLVYDAFLPTGKASSIASCEIGRSLLLFVASCISLLRQGGPGYIKGILVQVITQTMNFLNVFLVFPSLMTLLRQYFRV